MTRSCLGGYRQQADSAEPVQRVIGSAMVQAKPASVSDRARSRASGPMPASGYPQALTSLASASANSASPAAARGAARSG